MFVGITNMIIITSLVPTGTITVAHLITTLGLTVIALCLFESALSIHYFKKGEDKLARRLDIATLSILAVGFIVIVAAIMLVA